MYFTLFSLTNNAFKSTGNMLIKLGKLLIERKKERRREGMQKRRRLECVLEIRGWTRIANMENLREEEDQTHY